MRYLKTETFPTVPEHTCLVHSISPDLGMGIQLHDIPCHVCFDNISVNGDMPCWKCQEEGYRTLKLSKFWIQIFVKMGFLSR